MSRGGSQSGKSLVEMLVAMGILAVASLALATSNFQLSQHINSIKNMEKLDIFKRGLINLLSNSSSWNATLAGNGNLNACTQLYPPPAEPPPPPPPPVCNVTPWCRNWPREYWPALSALLGWNCNCPEPPPPPPPPPPPNYPHCGDSDSTAQRFAVMNADGSVYYDATDPRNGVTNDGQLCGPHATNPGLRNDNFGSDRCPFKFDLKYYTRRVSFQSQPVMVLSGELQQYQQYSADSIGKKTRYSIPKFYRAPQ